MRVRTLEWIAVPLLTLGFVIVGVSLNRQDVGVGSHGDRSFESQLAAPGDRSTRVGAVEGSPPVVEFEASSNELNGDPAPPPTSDADRRLDVDDPGSDGSGSREARSIGRFLPVAPADDHGGRASREPRSIGDFMDPAATVSQPDESTPVHIGGFIDVDVHGHGYFADTSEAIELGVFAPVPVD